MNKANYEAIVQAEVSRYRRDKGGTSPEVFAQIYLVDHCRLPFSRMHRDLFSTLATMADKRGARLAVAAPRGHAKSTIVSLAFVLWCVL